MGRGGRGWQKVQKWNQKRGSGHQEFPLSRISYGLEGIAKLYRNCYDAPLLEYHTYKTNVVTPKLYLHNERRMTKYSTWSNYYAGQKKKNHPIPWDSRRKERCSIMWYYAWSCTISAGQKSRTVADDLALRWTLVIKISQDRTVFFLLQISGMVLFFCPGLYFRKITQEKK